jgi:putative ABC transport system substrate-binding protein
MRRRDLVALGAATSLAWLPAGRAQPAATPVIGYLGTTWLETSAPNLPFFHDGLKEAGYVEGRNVSIAFRWAEGRYDRLPALAAELVALEVAVIAAFGGSPAALAARQATQTIPIVFLTADPVALGLVTSWSRPEGNITGVNFHSAELISKRLQLLRELVPNARSIAYLSNPTSPIAASQLFELQAAGSALGLSVQILEARSPGDIERAFQSIAERRPDAFLPATDLLFINQRELIVGLAARHAIPAIYEVSQFVTVGGLVSYGPSIQHAIRIAGVYVGRILAGARPADLPVQQPTRFELVINLRTAKSLGLAVPPSLLARADEVIE